MASIRLIKKDIDYLLSEVVADCYLAIYFHPEKKDEIVKVMEEAVELRNKLFDWVNNPAEKHSITLIKKHFRYIREELFSKMEELLEKLSAVTQQTSEAKSEETPI